MDITIISGAVAAGAAVLLAIPQTRTYVLQAVGFSKSLSAILAPVEKIVTELEDHHSQQTAKSSAFSDEAKTLAAKASAASASAATALATRDKIKALIAS